MKRTLTFNLMRLLVTNIVLWSPEISQATWWWPFSSREGPLPFKTISLDEFKAKYTDNGRLYRGGRSTRAIERIRAGQFRFDRDSGHELHCGADYHEINDQHGPYRNRVNSILPFSIIAPKDKPFVAILTTELNGIQNIKSLLINRLGPEKAAALKTARDRLTALGIDVVVHPPYSGTVYKSHVVIYNDSVIQVPSIAQFMADVADRYRKRLSEEEHSRFPYDLVAGDIFRTYVYQYSLLTDEEKRQVVSPLELDPSQAETIHSTLEWYSNYTGGSGSCANVLKHGFGTEDVL